jgi:hypothetical protein
VTTAQRIAKRMQETGRTRSKDSIYSVVSDDHNVICHTEATLDVWWNNLEPEDKAALYELHLEGTFEQQKEVQIEPVMLNPEFDQRIRAFNSDMAQLMRRSLSHCTNAIAGQQPARGVKANG